MSLALTLLALLSPAWSAPTDGVRRVEQGAATLWTRAEGTAHAAVPIVLVHGGPGMTSAPFEHTIGPLLAKHRPVIYTDYRGAGRSSRPAGPEHYSFAILAKDIEAIRAAYGYDRIVVMGHSNGGATALTWARAHAQSAAAVVLMCPLVSPVDLEVNMVKKMVRAPVSERAEALRIMRSDASLWDRFEGVLDALPAETKHGIQFADPANQAVFDGIMTRFREETGLASTMTPDLIAGMRATGFFAFDAFTFASELEMPLLVVSGTRDSELSVENSMRFSIEVPNGSILELHDSGHHPFVEQPDALVAGVQAFLEAQGL